MDPILAGLSNSLPQARSIEQLTRPLLDMLGSVTGLESTYLTSIDLKADVQHVRFARNAGELQIPEGLSVPWSDTLCKRALDEGRMCTSDVSRSWPDSEAARQLGIQTYVSAPVRTDDGILLGTLCAASAKPHQITPQAEVVLKLFSNVIANFLQRELLMEQLHAANVRLMSYALTDPLTGLPNRRALYEELERLERRAMREGGSVLVGLVDLDGFKGINDTYGHQQGDVFLQEVSRRLASTLRSSDMLGRIGGDEFVLVGPGPAIERGNAGPGGEALRGEAEDAARSLEERATAATIGRYQLGDAVVPYEGASVGVVAVDPRGLDAEAAVRLADARMYEIKRARKAARTIH
ncbi:MULTISPECIES: sensor domain-containing diguanylate cyclase [Achromobacter]|uniref:sensor domain-containing diguanylate cyclase n=1 Tax=Achromobacter TaxID=222 RepID=UPI000CFCACB8|nr:MULTISPECIES: sensor domain-containing diguanylate cyclase [Achromobacter]MDR6602878.1 diguanylate cyclase [Achromobacter deleyi]PQZ71902.1 diguanylate cyclase [Achromobacter sp. MYb9]HCW18502.1 sensor domain-containing diguanylate cyclase [Achromobacter sp.]